MSWRDLLETGLETVTLPWVGGRTLHSAKRQWKIEGRLPTEHGWYSFKIRNKVATEPTKTDPSEEALGDLVKGYLVGDRLVPDGAPAVLTDAESVHLISDGLGRFARVVAGRVYDDGPLIFKLQDMPLGPEEAVYQAFLDKRNTVGHIKGVAPGLDAAFRIETRAREQAEKRRQELAELRRLEAERLEKEERRKELVEKLGSGVSRRELAKIDFREAATAALVVGGAELLDERKGRAGERVVVYRAHGRKFECVVDEQLRVIESGICLEDHHTGEKGDTRFTLETLPAVVGQAIRERRLVIRRHTDDDYQPNNDFDEEEYT